jgi:hypothetical protein
MDQDRRELSTRDVVRPAEANDRADASAAIDQPLELPAGQATPSAGADSGRRALLFPGDQVEQLRTQWTDIQAAFVDSPRMAVERADGLVTDTMRRLADVFSTERSNLEQQWDRGGDVTTEDLRVALQRYRSFFDRLLSV